MCNRHLTAGIMSRTALFRALCVKGGTHPNIARNGLGIDGLLRPSGLCTPVAEAGHAFEDKAPGFVAHHSPLHPGLTTAFSRRCGEEDNRPDDFVIMLDRIDKLPPKLLAFFLSSHLNFAQK